MSEKFRSIAEEIVWMQSRIPNPDLDMCDDLDQYEEYLQELSLTELYDVFSSVHSRYIKS